MSDSDEGCEIEIKFEGSNVYTRLTEVVRNQYLKFLEKQLENNLNAYRREKQETWYQFDSVEDETIQQCLKILEDVAIKEATITQLYQKGMLKMIDIVRQCTKESRLLEQLEKILIQNSVATKLKSLSYATKGTQTETAQLSLDERIDLFQKEIIEKNKENCMFTNNNELKNRVEQRKRRNTNGYCNDNKKRLAKTQSEPKISALHSPTPPPPNKTIQKINEQLEGDEIAQELDKLFMEEEVDLDEIFGIKLNKSNESQASQPNNLKKGEEQKVSNTNETPLNPTLDASLNIQSYRKPVQDLRHSLWPCENLMRKRRLSATLTRLVEEDIRWHDVLRIQFSVLFGEDDNELYDDFAPCSPSVELNEVVRCSCVRRISPWVVSHLMKPLNDGLIGNRFLFKKLAKRLAYHIILVDQYPNEQLIKRYVENFFCLHTSVMSIDDLADISTLMIDSNDKEI